MSNVYIAVSNGKSLGHHGILGMKWGVRRFQNYDGTLTAKGRKRYYREDGSLSKEGKEYRTKIIDQARTNTDLLDSYREGHRKMIEENGGNIRTFVKERDDQAVKALEAYDKYKETGSSEDKELMDKEFRQFLHNCNTVYEEADYIDDTKGKEVYDKYRSQIADRTLKQLGFESTEKGKEFVETMIADRLRVRDASPLYIDRPYVEKLAAEYLKEHPNSKLTEDDIMYWFYD